MSAWGSAQKNVRLGNVYTPLVWVLKGFTPPSKGFETIALREGVPSEREYPSCQDTGLTY